ncbi:hypothetical protein BJF79_08035 [Actinomadura sp. CNU-125]|uniref:cytochrome P450 n=1 Tax=Actinomadura sp. CNU-125 TaxID=1904961 RepID=UPI00095E5E91|nr:cytochrome P450 [Actinomadura sp. CNU-125]OLT33221.1 hypothetical protein BJF79_08035 [Actinomadura sp. CNU-125]
MSAEPTAAGAVPNIPVAPGALPVLGHLLPALRDPWAFLKSLPAHGDLVHIKAGPLTAVVVCDPYLTRQVLVNDATFDKGGLLFERGREVGGNGLGSCVHAEHRRQRRLAQPAFHRDMLPGYTGTMTATIDEVTASWRHGQVIDLVAETMQAASTIVMRTLFSDSLPPTVMQQALDDVTTILQGVLRRTVIPPPVDRALGWLPAGGARRYARARDRLRRTLGTVIAQRRTAHGPGPGRPVADERKDLLAALLAARDTEGDGSGLSDDEIVDHAVTFFGAGVETTAATLAWALHLLGGHPEVARRLRAEVDAVLDGRTATHEDLPALDLTGRVITETLRLKSPAWLLTRSVTADARLGTHVLPAGTTVVFSPYLIHHRSDLFPRPDRFDPDRWLPERSAAIPRQAFIPFGMGARKCIGDQFALHQASIFLATITARWRLEPVHRTVRPVRAVAMRPGRLPMRVLSRSTNPSEESHE